MADATTGGNQPQEGQEQQQQPARRKRGRELTDDVAALISAGQQPQDGEQDEAPPRSGAGDEHGQGDETGGEGGEDEAGDGEQEDHGATSLDDIARALKLSTKDLNAVEVKVGPHTLTLGELKDKLPQLAKLETDRAEFAERVTATELEQIDAHRRILAIIDAFPNHAIPPAVMRRLEAQHAEQREREAALLNKARPQWGDPKYAQAQRESMSKVGQRYGFSQAELASINDHRIVLLLQDYAHAIARIEEAKGAARRVEVVGDKQLTTQTPRAAAGGRPGSNGAASGASKKAQIAGRVADLIKRG